MKHDGSSEELCTQSPPDSKGFAYIGARIPRAYDFGKVTGEYKYVSDLYLPNMLYAKVLRSPVPHARILKIDVRDAERINGVAAVITAKDTPVVKFSFSPAAADKLFLESEKVRYIGDEIAAVAAADERTAEKALERIRVEYEELPALFSPEESMAEKAPEIHSGVSRNIASHFVREYGDINRGFSNADYIFEDHFETSRVTSCCLETMSSLAVADSTGITVWSCTQTPFPLVQQLAQVLQIPPSRIKVVQMRPGGAFGSREGMDPIDPICVLLSTKTRRPVKIKVTRKEEFESSRTRHPMKISVKSGLTKGGDLTAREVRIVTDNGAYNSHGVSVTRSAAGKASQLYRIQNFKVEGFVVYTNTVYGGAMRGYGNPQINFAIESHMDMVAQRLGLNPVQFRLRNTTKSGDLTASGSRITSCGLDQCIEICERELGVKEVSRRPYRGFGVAAMIHTGGGNKTYGHNFSSVKLMLTYDGMINVYVASVDLGQGSHIVILQIVAEELGVPISRCRLVMVDTDQEVTCMGSHGSRVTFIAGNAAKLAASDTKQQILRVAAGMLDADVEDLAIRNGEIYDKKHSDKTLTLESIAKNSYYDRSYKVDSPNGGHPIVGWGIYKDTHSNKLDPISGYGNANPTYTFGAQGVELEIDPKTGTVRIVRVIAAYDVGRVINLDAAEGQLYGGVMHGIGYALSEELSLDKNGGVRQSNFLDYKMLTASDLPKIAVHFVESVDPAGPFGAKSLGESVTIPTAAAIANAIYDATGIRFTKIPIKSEDILNALSQSQRMRNGGESHV